MSVLIKGMMMPTNCQTCPFVQNEYPIGGEALVYRCRCTFTQKIADNPAFERNKDCPLVEVEEAEESDDCLTNFLIAIAKEREKDETIGEVKIGNYRVTGNRFRQVWRYEPEGDKE